MNIIIFSSFEAGNCVNKKIALYFVNITVLVFLMGQNPKCPGYN